MNDRVPRRGTPLPSPCHRAPDDFLGSVWNVRCLIHNGGVLSSQLKQYWSEIFSSRSHDYLAHAHASREKQEIERKLQEIRDCFAGPDYSAKCFRLEILGNQFQEQLIRCQQRFGQFQHAGIPGR